MTVVRSFREEVEFEPHMAMPRRRTAFARTFTVLQHALQADDTAAALAEIARLYAEKHFYDEDDDGNGAIYMPIPLSASEVFAIIERCEGFLRAGQIRDAESLIFQASFERRDEHVRAVYDHAMKRTSE